MDSGNRRRLSLALYALCLVALAGAVYLISQSVKTAGATGILRVSSPDKKSSISVSRNDSTAKFIGVGNAKVRLAPGSYLVGASDNGRQVYGTVIIKKQMAVNLNLNPANAVVFPTVEAVNFSGFDSLISNGLTSAQVNIIKSGFFRYKPTEKTVAIDTSSVVPGPHNPDVDIGFSLQFNLSLDSKTLKAVVSYSDLTSARLQLFDQQGSAVFDSSK